MGVTLDNQNKKKKRKQSAMLVSAAAESLSQEMPACSYILGFVGFRVTQGLGYTSLTVFLACLRHHVAGIAWQKTLLLWLQHLLLLTWSLLTRKVFVLGAHIAYGCLLPSKQGQTSALLKKMLPSWL